MGVQWPTYTYVFTYMRSLDSSRIFIVDHQTSNSRFQLCLQLLQLFSATISKVLQNIQKCKTVAMSHHEKVVRPSAAFIFLSAIPYLDVKNVPSLDEKCAICTEPYLEGPCELRDAPDAPVKIRCGHIFGHNCLVRWMLSGNFDNSCPFCRAQVVYESDLESPDPNVVAQLVYFENFLVEKIQDTSNRIVLNKIQDTSNRKQELLELFDQYRNGIKNIGCATPEVFNKDRVVMIWEEVLDAVSRKDEEARLVQLRLRDYWVERDRHDAAEAATGNPPSLVSKSNCNHRERCRNRDSLPIGTGIGFIPEWRSMAHTCSAS